MDFDPVEVIMTLLRYVPAIIVIVAALFFIYSFKVVVVTNEMERTNHEIAENLFASKLTYDRAVFDPAKLNKFINDAKTETKDDDNEPNIEPIDVARHCSIGYRAEIYDFVSGDKWAFGYVPNDDKDVKEQLESRISYDTAVLVPSQKGRGYESMHPARLTITTRETWLSTIGCMIENAYYFKVTQTMNVPCVIETRSFTSEYGPSEKSCYWNIGRSSENGKHICFSKPNTAGTVEKFECRYFPNNIRVVNFLESYKTMSVKKLIIYPLKTENAMNMADNERQALCQELKNNADQIATESDVVKSVVLCIN